MCLESMSDGFSANFLIFVILSCGIGLGFS